MHIRTDPYSNRSPAGAVRTSVPPGRFKVCLTPVVAVEIKSNRQSRKACRSNRPNQPIIQNQSVYASKGQKFKRYEQTAHPEVIYAHRHKVAGPLVLQSAVCVQATALTEHASTWHHRTSVMHSLAVPFTAPPCPAKAQRPAWYRLQAQFK